MSTDRRNMGKRIKDWIKQYNEPLDKGEKQLPINPLGWGVMFFALWLSLIFIPNKSDLQNWVADFMLICSFLMMLFIIPPLRKWLESREASTVIVPFVKQMAVLAFFISWLAPLQDLGALDFTLAVVFGYVWTIIILGNISAGIYNPVFRWIFAVITILVFLYKFKVSGIGSWPLLPVIGIAIVAAIWPKIFRGMSLA